MKNRIWFLFILSSLSMNSASMARESSDVKLLRGALTTEACAVNLLRNAYYSGGKGLYTIYTVLREHSWLHTANHHITGLKDEREERIDASIYQYLNEKIQPICDAPKITQSTQSKSDTAEAVIAFESKAQEAAPAQQRK